MVGPMLVQDASCFRGGARFTEVCFFFLPFGHASPRWTSVDVPEGWLKVIRGQRPPSNQWPRSGKRTERKSSAAPEVPRRQAAPKPSSPPQRVPADDPAPRVSRDPDHVVADAQVRALKLEAAISALGEDDPAVSGLKDALQRVRSQAQVRPLSQRIAWTQEFVT